MLSVCMAWVTATLLPVLLSVIGGMFGNFTMLRSDHFMESLAVINTHDKMSHMISVLCC